MASILSSRQDRDVVRLFGVAFELRDRRKHRVNRTLGGCGLKAGDEALEAGFRKEVASLVEGLGHPIGEEQQLLASVEIQRSFTVLNPFYRPRTGPCLAFRGLGSSGWCKIYGGL